MVYSQQRGMRCVLGTTVLPTLLSLLLSGCVCCCWALKSSDCAEIALGVQRSAACPSPVCGAVPVPDGPTFLEKLSPQCRSLMERYRTSNRLDGKLGYGFNSSIRDYEYRQQACPNSYYAMQATNPVVVEAPGAVLTLLPHMLLPRHSDYSPCSPCTRSTVIAVY